MAPIRPLGTITGDSTGDGGGSGGVAFTDAVLQYKLDEGSGSTATDSIGSADGNFQASWASDADSVGGYRGDYNGSSEYLEISSGRPAVGDQGAIVFTVEIHTLYSNSEPDQLFRHQDPNTGDRAFLRVDDSSGTVAYGLGDTGSTNASLTLSENIRYRLGLAWDSGSWELWSNGSLADSGSYSGSIDFNADTWSWMRDDRDQRYVDGFNDNCIVCDAHPSSTEFQDDYNNQPWS